MSFSLETIKEHLVESTRAVLLFGVLAFGCSPGPGVVPDIMELRSNLELVPEEGRWYFQGKPFNGYAVKYYGNNQIAEKIGFIGGKKNGVATWWHANGQKKTITRYIENKMHGLKQSWWPNGNISSESTMDMGVGEGTQTYWHMNGQMAKKTNFINGRQEGLQQAWLANGKIYVNYVAKNGRIFGLKRSNLCYELDDEQLVFD